MVKFGIIALIIIITIIIIAGTGWGFVLNPNLMSQIFHGPAPIFIVFDKPSYEPNTAAKITVIDPFANTNNAIREKIDVQVYSDSDAAGIKVQLEEYRTDSDRFVTHPYLVKLTTLGSDPSIDALQIKPGDKIYAKYVTGTVSVNTTASISPPTYLPNSPDENHAIDGGVNITGSTSTSILTNQFGTVGTLTPSSTSISASQIPVLGCFDDVDNDGICDEWEDSTATGITGLAIPYGSATYILNCDPNKFDSATGANDDCPGPDMQDIYIQASYLGIPNSISQAPSPAAISDLRHVFYQHGIRLHFLTDSQSIGYYNDVTAVPGTPTDRPGTNSFFGIKNAYFGSPEERSCQSPNSPPPNTSCAAYLHDLLIAKSQVFHYALFIHAQAAHPGSSGWAEIFGNDMVISMGAFTGGVGSENQVAGTFMHELGHNLNLNHGGAPTDTLNCKPNYLSAMNYMRQFPYYVQNWSLDYSNAKYDLNEGSLYENQGIGTTSQGVTAYSYKDSSGIWHIGTGPSVPGNAGIDWDGSSTSFSSSPLPPTEIQNFGIPDCSEATSNALNGFNDWANINLVFQTSSNFANGAAFTPSAEREMTRGDVDTLFMKEYGVNSTGKNLDELYKELQNNMQENIQEKGEYTRIAK